MDEVTYSLAFRKARRLAIQLIQNEEGATDFRDCLARKARFDASVEGHWLIFISPATATV
jgi:hypothetical protein